MTKATTLIIKAQSRATLDSLISDFSCYTPEEDDSVIIDLDFVEDDPVQRDNFFEITGLSEREIEGASYICFYT